MFARRNRYCQFQKYYILQILKPFSQQRIVWLAAFFCILSLPLFSNDSIPAREKDSVLAAQAPVYKISYSDQLGIYLYGISKYSNFELREAGQPNDSIIKYSPNSNFNLGAGFSYKWMGFSLAFNLGFINNDNSLKGKTSSLDLQLDIFTRRLLMNANLQAYKGFYWYNPEVFYPEWNKQDSLLVRPDITTLSLGFNGIYVFKHDKFSIRAPYQFTERQLKSCGSWLAGWRFSVYSMVADSSIVPEPLYGFYPNLSKMGGLGSLSMGGSFGYTYTFVWGNYFFVNGLLMIGLNLQSLAAYDLDDEPLGSASSVSSHATFRFSLGVNKPGSYYGLSFFSDSFLLKNPNETELTYSFGKFRIYYGLRFDIKKT